MSRLTEFYRGTGTDSEGRTLAEVWAFSDDDLETIHNFIQWMFPLREPSRYNPDAPLLTASDIAAFRSDPELNKNLRQSFEVFLTFLGLRYDGERVEKTLDFDEKTHIWLHPNHNWLRITRVLASSRMLGLEDASQALLNFLEAYRGGGHSGITTETFRYWKDAASTDLLE